MPREQHDWLHPATAATLKENPKAAAFALQKTERHVYQILSGDAADKMTFFMVMYERLAAAGLTAHYRREISYIDEKHAGRRTRDLQPGEAIQNQFHEFSRFVEHFMQGISDGTLDLKETDDLLDILGVLKPLVETSEKSLLTHKAKLEREGAK